MGRLTNGCGMEPGFLIVGLLMLSVGTVSTIFHKQLHRAFDSAWQADSMKYAGGKSASKNNSPASILIGTVFMAVLGFLILLAGVFQ